VKQAYMDMDISMDIHGKSVDMDMDMDEKFHIHGKPATPTIEIFRLFDVGHSFEQETGN